MRNSMLLTPSSLVLSRPLGSVKHLLAAVLIGLLGSGSAVADASDWLPLAVGNSWTYAHEYYENDDGNDDLYSQWTNYTAQFPNRPQFTLSVLRTEVIDGHTYFVISDMPEYWPPVPPQFIAGKKLRWVGDQLMERTADGEQALFRFGGASGASGEASYTVPTPEGTLRVTARENRSEHTHDNYFGFSGGAEAAGPSNWYELLGGESGATGESGVTIGLGAALFFLKGFGVQQCQMALYDDDAPLFKNIQKAKHAVLDGRTVTVREAKAAAGQASSSDATSIEWFSWGAVKQVLVNLGDRHEAQR